MNARNAKISSDTLLEHHKRNFENMQRAMEADDEEAVRGVVFKNSASFVKRLEDDEQPAKVPKPTPQTDYIKVLPISQSIAPKKIAPTVKIVPANGNKKTAQNGDKKGTTKKVEVKPSLSLVDY